MKPTALAGLLWGALSGLALAAADASALYPNTPLLLWSDERAVFNGQNTYLSASMDQRDIAVALTDVASRTSSADEWGILGEPYATSQQAELLCLLLLPSLRTDELTQFAEPGSLSFVQEAVETAASSVVVPHTTRSLSLRAALADPEVPAISHRALEAFVSTDGAWHDLLVDGKTDLVIVEIADVDGLLAADAAIRAAARTLTEATRGLVDFALTGDYASPGSFPGGRGRKLAAQEKAAATPSIVCDAGYLIGYNAAGKAFCFSHYVNMTPELLTGIIFGVFFLFLAYVGLSVLHAIQTPTKYPLHGPPRGKEF